MVLMPVVFVGVGAIEIEKFIWVSVVVESRKLESEPKNQHVLM